jgi:hypothetical protein
MAKQAIGIGSLPNDGGGDSLRDGAIKVNSNFNEIYTALGDGNAITNSIAFASVAGVSTLSDYATNAGIATFATTAGFTSFTTIAGFSSVSNYSTVAGLATNATYADTLINSPDIIVGVITASRFVGDASYASGIVTSLVAGSNVTIERTGGIATVSIAGGGGGGGGGFGVASQWLDTLSGITTASRVGIGTTIPDTSSQLHVKGGRINVTGVNAGNEAIQIENGAKVNFGTSGAAIYYDSVDLRIDTNSSIRMSDGARNVFTANAGGGSELFFDGDRKFTTTTIGGQVDGTLNVVGLTTTNALYSAGDITSAGFVTATTYYGNGGDLTGIVTTLVGGANVNLTIDGGQVTVDVNSDSVWNGNATGINTLGNIGIGTTTASNKLTVIGESSFDGAVGFTSDITLSSGRIEVPASSNIKIGADYIGSGGSRNIGLGDRALSSLSSGGGHNIAIGDLSGQSVSSGQYNITIGDRCGREMMTGDYNVILGGFDGQNSDLDIRTSDNNIVLSDGEGNVRYFVDSNGKTGINTTIARTELSVLGVVSATSFYGQLNAEQLTGILPIIDGSNLTGVTAVGSGIELENNGSSIGVGATLNFADNLDIELSAGVATVSISDLNISNLNVSGISTLGVATATQLNVSGVSTFQGISTFQGNVYLGDSNSLYFGAGNDLEIKSDGVNGYIRQQTSSLSLYSDELYLRNNTNNEPYLKGVVNGSVELYYDNSKKFETSSSGVDITGSITATGGVTANTFSGSGANLTNLPSSQLTGTLPAIDGSLLTGIVASGTGIALESNGFPVGSATTIDLGTGLSVELSGGIATVTASGGSGGSRVVVSGSTTSIADESIGNIDITGYKSYALMHVGLSTTGWIRLYTDSTSRDNDINRGLGNDPTPGSGVIAEVVTTGISTEQIISPFTMGGNLMDPANTTIYASIKNLSGSTQNITANLTILPLEV